MPRYRVAFRQAIEFNGAVLRKWSNTINITAATAIAAATQAVNAWKFQLRGAARDYVFCYEVYATDITAGGAGTPATQDFHTQALDPGDQRGTYATNRASDQLYWRDTCVVVELPVPGGRPDRKFWRPGLIEADFNSAGVFDNTALVAAIETRWSNVCANYDVVDGDGSALTTANVKRVTARRMGRTQGFDLPTAPPLG